VNRRAAAYYERAEIKDDRLTAGDRTRTTPSRLTRIREQAAAAGWGETSLARPRHLRGARGSRSGSTRSSRRSRLATASAPRVQTFHSLLQSLMSGRDGASVSRARPSASPRSGYVDALEAERTIEARGRSRTSRSSSASRQGSTIRIRSRRSRPSCRRCLSNSDQDAPCAGRGAGQVDALMTLHNAKGSRVPCVS